MLVELAELVGEDLQLLRDDRGVLARASPDRVQEMKLKKDQWLTYVAGEQTLGQGNLAHIGGVPFGVVESAGECWEPPLRDARNILEISRILRASRGGAPYTLRIGSITATSLLESLAYLSLP